MNFQKNSPIEIANEICELFDSYGFTSETPVDTSELLGKIASIIEDGTSHLNVLIDGLEGELLKLPNINTETECGCVNLPPDPLKIQTGE